MPVRYKAIAVIDFLEGLDPEDIYVQLVESIDWNRVQLEASGLCLARHSKLFPNDIDIPCGACLMAAMLEKNTFPEWIGKGNDELAEDGEPEEDVQEAAGQNA